jgi:cytochrome c-type biogenesis protein CcmH
MTLGLGAMNAAEAYVPQQVGSEPLASPELEARVHALGKKLRCAVCQGLSISDSPAGMARAQLDKVRELVAAGKSDEEINDYFVARYGEWVLLEPPQRGLGWLVWLGPAMLILVGLVVTFQQVRKVPMLDATSDVAPPTTDSSYLDAVRKELEK